MTEPPFEPTREPVQPSGRSSRGKASPTPQPPSGRASASNSSVVQTLIAGIGTGLQQIPVLLQRLRPLLAKLQQWWGQTLPIVRSRLPTNLSRNLSDRVLTAIALTLLFLLLWLGLALLSPAPAQSRKSPRTSIPTADPAATTPAPQFPTPDPECIAAIQDQVAAITEQYSPDLIQSAQANFRDSSLTVKLGEAWYSLGSSRQDSLASELLQRAQKLSFTKLEIVNSEGDRLARSAVIGEGMVVLERVREE